MRDAILEAAIEVAMQQGILATTLDGVCKRAGISKGGLVHYFRSKDELLVAMMERFVGHFEQQLQALEQLDPNPRHRRIRAMLKAARAMVDGQRIGGVEMPPAHAMRFMLSLLTASANNPMLLRSVHTKFGAMRDAMLEDSAPDGHLSLVLWMAFDGLMLWQYLGVLDANGPLASDLIDRMLKIVDQPANKMESTAPAPRKTTQTKSTRVAAKKSTGRKAAAPQRKAQR